MQRRKSVAAWPTVFHRCGYIAIGSFEQAVGRPAYASIARRVAVRLRSTL